MCGTDRVDAQALTLTFPASETAVRRSLAAACDRLAEWRLDDDTVGAVEIVLAEVLNNVVEHAYPGRPAGEIVLWMELRQDAVAIAVIDDGASMPGDTLPEPEAADLPSNRDDLPEGGFGWGLIRALSCGLAYRRVNERNRLSFRIPRAIRGEPAGD